jgi:hypothetical protein
MPIKVQCACGAAFAAKDELAGRTVKCPKCQQPLAIPAAGAPAMPAAAPRAPAAGGAGRPLGSPLPSQGPPPGGGDLFAEAGLHTFQAGTQPCPGCSAPLPDSAVLCVKCGYNRKLGRRMETIKQVGGTLLPGGHSVTADELLQRAARTIEEDKEEERKKTREGLPVWVYGIGLIACVGFMVAMAWLPPQIALLTGGILIYGIALIVNLYSVVRILIIAFTEGIGHGIGCLFCGLYMLVYCFMRWDQCGGYFLMMFFTNIITNLIAFILQLVLATSADDEEAYIPPLPEATAIVRVERNMQHLPIAVHV